jgi:hypothetical protein
LRLSKEKLRLFLNKCEIIVNMLCIPKKMCKFAS